MSTGIHRASQVALVVKDPPVNAGDVRQGFDPWVGKIPCMRAWKFTPVFLPRESHGRRSLVGYSPWGCTESDWSIYTQRHSQVWSLIHSLIHSIGYYLLSNYYVVKTILDAGSHLKQSHLRSTYNLERGCYGSLARGGKPGTSVAAANRVVPCLWWL